MKFVEVRWVDAMRSDGWCVLAEAPHVVKCITRGWLIREDDEQVILAGTTSGDGEFGEVIAIPRGMVTAMETLKIKVEV